MRVVFWASEYKVCEEDIPQLRALYQDNKAKGFEIVGVALDFEKSTAMPFVQKNKMNWKHLYQPNPTTQTGGLNSPIAESFGIISLPTMFLVDKEGKVVNDLADSYSVSDDQREYTISIKKNVTWHDGQPLNARDVFFTYNILQQ